MRFADFFKGYAGAKEQKQVVVTGYLTAVMASVLAACLGVLADPLLDGGSPFLTPTFVFLLSVILATRYGGRKPLMLTGWPPASA
ncbi:MAG: hypothetical protein V4671_00520 [Armatimonadota bacterium]